MFADVTFCFLMFTRMLRSFPLAPSIRVARCSIVQCTAGSTPSHGIDGFNAAAMRHVCVRPRSWAVATMRVTRALSFVERVSSVCATAVGVFHSALGIAGARLLAQVSAPFRSPMRENAQGLPSLQQKESTYAANHKGLSLVAKPWFL